MILKKLFMGIVFGFGVFVTNASAVLYNFDYCGNTTIYLNEHIDDDVVIENCNVVIGDATITGTLALYSGTVTILDGATVAVENNMLIDSYVNLGNAALNIGGYVRQGGGVLDTQTGRLNITGDYELNSGKLTMQNDSAYVKVNGDFTTTSITSQHGYLMAGTFEVKGDFSQIQGPAYNSRYNFYTSGTHTVILSGDSNQTVSFAYGEYASRFNRLEVDNTSAEGVTFQTATTVLNTLTATNCQVRLDLDNVTYGTLVLDNRCTPLSLLVAGQTSYFANDAGVIGQRTYNSDGSYTGTLTLADGSTMDVGGTYSSVGDVLTLNRTIPSSKTLTLTYLGEDAGVTTFSVSIDGGIATTSYSYPTAQERDTAVANAALSTIIGTTRYFLTSKGDIGQRTYDSEGTYTGSITFANGNTITVSGTYDIIGDQVIINRSTPTEVLIELTYINTDAGVMNLDVSVNGGEVFQSASYTTEEERDAALPKEVNPAVIMYLLN